MSCTIFMSDHDANSVSRHNGKATNMKGYNTKSETKLVLLISRYIVVMKPLKSLLSQRFSQWNIEPFPEIYPIVYHKLIKKKVQ